MADTSKIEWTDATWNVVTGCEKVSPGCDNCYAETFAERWRGIPGHHFETGFDVTLRPERLTLPLRWRKPKRVFVNSMSDLFHKDIPDEYIARVWQIMGATPQHTYQILTKRHGRMKSWTNRWYSGEIPEPYDVRPILGYEGYAVTTHGEVLGKRSDTRGGMKLEAGEQGHLRAMLYGDGERRGRRELVHRLVLTAFVRPPNPGEQACHRNGDPSDNRLSNLYWGTQEANWRDRLTHGNGRSYHKLSEQQVAEIRKRHAAGQSAYSMAKDYGVSDTQIRNIVLNRQWATAHLVKVPTPAPARVVLDNCWLGVSVEDQKRADLRIPALVDTPAAVRFLSCEPLLGPLDLTAWMPGGHASWRCQGPDCRRFYAGPLEQNCPNCGREGHWTGSHTGNGRPNGQPISWVIVGGESGRGARPMAPQWATSLRDQCQAADVPFFFKQWGEYAPTGYLVIGGTSKGTLLAGDPVDDLGHRVELACVGKKNAGRELDGQTHDAFPAAA